MIPTTVPINWRVFYLHIIHENSYRSICIRLVLSSRRNTLYKEGPYSRIYFNLPSKFCFLLLFVGIEEASFCFIQRFVSLSRLQISFELYFEFFSFHGVGSSVTFTLIVNSGFLFLLLHQISIIMSQVYLSLHSNSQNVSL